MAVFWNVSPCTFVVGTNISVYLAVSIYDQSLRCHIAEYRNIYGNCRDNHTFHVALIVFRSEEEGGT